MQGELDRVSQTLTGRIRQLAERYATPLPQLTDEVATLAARVDGAPQEDGGGMEVKPGYKQTEVGRHPGGVGGAAVRQNWPMRSAVTATGSRAIAVHVQPIARSMPLISRTMTSGCRRHSTICELPKTATVSRQSRSNGDVLISMTATSVAELASFDGCLRLVNQAIAQTQRTADGDRRRYLFSVHSAASVGHDLQSRRDGSACAANISSNTSFGKLPIRVPAAHAEQRAIATALSDVDALLGGLDRLIAKKRDLKQAAMQQLLTGQTRLPGFHGEWEVKTLGESQHIPRWQSCVKSRTKPDERQIIRTMARCVLD